MDWKTALVLLVLLVAVAWLLRKRRAASTDAQSPDTVKRSKKTAYHAVSIKFANNACAAAKEMAGRRFLATAAPKLPLPECNVADCKCRFVHHQDRRSGKDRRSPFAAASGMGAAGTQRDEQRSGRDRRRDEEEDFF